ncbi:MAG: amino acid adenylation domain-containing protein, partial [bacterium]|nr:amino acid adenylation domain-containing protein [bacterium]
GKCSIGQVTLGQPIANMRCYIQNRNGNLAPLGVTGELCFSGPGIARGYLNQPELTAEKFQLVSNSLHPHSTHSTIYRTGDLGQWLPDGNIRFLGRRDEQVKIRGHRVELAEVENRLGSIPGIKSAAAAMIPPKDQGDTAYLCAWYVTEKEIDETELRQTLTGLLPVYMVPSYFIPMERLPLTANNKIDKKSLPDPIFRSSEKQILPQSELESKVTEIWMDILDIGVNSRSIGIDENFFRL